MVKKLVKKKVAAKEEKAPAAPAEAEEKKAPAPAKEEKAAAPKKEEKARKKEEKAKPAGEEKPDGVSPEQKAKLTKQAVEDIRQGIAEKDSQKNGSAFIPKDWHSKYKKALGAYKKFVAGQECFDVIERGNGGWFVVKAGEKPSMPALSKPGQNWKRMLENAWNTYCQATPKPERSADAFLQAMPPGARKHDGEDGAEKKQEPAAEAAGELKKKRKVSDASAASEKTEPEAAEPETKKKKVLKKKA